MSRDPIEFWFSVGSGYTYLSVMRLAQIETKYAVTFRWRPFYLGKIFQEANYHPFVGKPSKISYMWRDIERRASKYGIPIRVPAPYPLPRTPFAVRLAYVGLREGWGQDYIRASYRQWFQQGDPSGEEPNLSASLRLVGQDPDRAIALAENPDTDKAVDAETSEAKTLGICGSPTFVVGRELFWGDDRLEDAIQWQKHGCLTSTWDGR